MIEEAFILGQIGKAVYKENSRYFLIDAEDTERPVECRLGDIGLLFDTGSEITTLEGREIAFDDIIASLEFDYTAHGAFSLVISGLDYELSDETRLLAIEAAEELLQDASIRTFVRNRILARLLPSAADIEGAMFLSSRGDVEAVRSIYKEVRQTQKAIHNLLEVWEEVALELYGLDEERARVEKTLVEIGLFADIVALLNSGEIQNLNNIIVHYGRTPQLHKRLPQGMLVINSIRMRLLNRFGSKRQEEIYTDIPELEQGEPEITDPIIELINSYVGKRESKQPKQAGGQAAFETVGRQITVIKNLINRGNIHRANLFLRDLIEFNLRHGEKKHVGMTLCSLAKTALDASQFEMAERLVQYASMLGVDDPVIPTTRAEILRTLRRLDEALTIYDEVINRFPNDAVAPSGRANILKEMGRLDEALAAYGGAIERFPNDAIPYSGRANVLKEMGKLDEALAAYDGAIERFSNEVFPYAGRAEVLKEMGKLDEALTAYDGAIERFPNDAVPYSGRAEVLKEMARLDEALAAYESAIKHFPHEAVPRTGCAGVLMLMNRLEEARALLSYSRLVSKDDWINYHIAAMSYLKSGDIDEAIKRLEYGLQNVPWVRDKSFFATALAVAKIKNREFADVVEILETNVVHTDRFQRQKDLLLISHSQAELDRKQDAAKTLASISYLGNPHIVKLKEALSQRYNLRQNHALNPAEIDVSILDAEIYKEEFYLAMAA